MNSSTSTLSKSEKNWLKATLLAGGSLTVMAAATIAPAQPKISVAFSHVKDSEFVAQLLLVLPSLVIAMTAPFVGYAIDRIGRKQILIGSLILYALSGTAGYYLNDLWYILVSRGFLGMAVAGTMVTITTLVADYFEGKERNQFMGMQGAFMTFGGIIYVILGGLLAEINWRLPFLIYGASLLVFPLILKHIFEPGKAVKPTGFTGKAPLPGLRKMIYWVGLIGMIIFYMVPVQIPFYLAEITPVGELEIGLAIAAMTLCAAPAALMFQKLKEHISYPLIYALGFGIMGLGYLVVGNAYSYAQVVVGLMIGGAGFGLMIPNATVWLMEIAPAHLRGRMIGILNMAMFLGQFLSPFVVKPLIERTSIGITFGTMAFVMFGMSAAFVLSSKYFTELMQKHELNA